MVKTNEISYKIVINIILILIGCSLSSVVLHTGLIANMAAFEEDQWNEALTSVKSQFKIEGLLPEQGQSIRAFMEKGNVFVNLRTGYGKSMVFRSIPIVADILLKKERGSSLKLVISHLKSLMEGKIEFLGTVGIPAISVGDINDPEIIQQIINGYYILVYCSPEAMLSTATWRGIFSYKRFQDRLIGFAVDEARCITQYVYLMRSFTVFIFKLLVATG